MTISRSSAHAQWFSHQNDGADYHDIIKRCHENGSCKKGREYKVGSIVEQGSSAAAVLLSGYLDIHFRVFS